ncbi:uncharacterized protein LOC110980326 [Acanthaster planci]|uniref:Uncharacterized protein LOC110980326 n=1 Tax=Acanthaster planci TaxID=133434 RepID=A0A8B7YH82_ACAPL|nr:uncharacterized protein LOC110980326 [Acanthaster planci]
MASALFAIFSLILLSGVSAKEPRPCCWISQMTGQAELQGTKKLEDGSVILEESELQWAYDATFQAEAFIFDEILENSTVIKGRIVNFYDQGLSFYIIDNQGVERCAKIRIPARFPKKCIPEHAEYYGNRTLGNDSLVAHEWKLNTVAGGDVVNVSFLIQDEYCVPISFGVVSQEPRVRTIAYGDIELGICDREKFFRIPDECRQVNDGTPKGHMYQQIMQTAFNM